VEEGLGGVSGRSGGRLPLALSSLGLFQLTRREMDLSVDRPVALPYLKAAVAVSEGNRRSVSCHAERAGGESF
jgi:hypothetical protein